MLSSPRMTVDSHSLSGDLSKKVLVEISVISGTLASRLCWIVGGRRWFPVKRVQRALSGFPIWYLDSASYAWRNATRLRSLQV